MARLLIAGRLLLIAFLTPVLIDLLTVALIARVSEGVIVSRMRLSSSCMIALSASIAEIPAFANLSSFVKAASPSSCPNSLRITDRLSFFAAILASLLQCG